MKAGSAIGRYRDEATVLWSNEGIATFYLTKIGLRVGWHRISKEV